MRFRHLPWKRPPRLGVCLALVAVAVLIPVQAKNVQDISRWALSKAIVHGTLETGRFDGARSSDRSLYAGHVYTDKAPGLSLVAIPAVMATRLPASGRWEQDGDWRLWVIRLSVNGIAFLVLLACFAFVAEGIAPGTGLAAAMILGLASTLTGMAVSALEHVATSAALFGAFLLLWRGGRRSLVAAGLLAGLAVLFEYQAALAALVLAGYALHRRGPRGAGTYVLGALPAAALLGLYNRAAFGSPLHLSYRYVATQFAQQQSSGFFGIGVPQLHAMRQILIGGKGLLVASPVLVLGVAGLVLAWRRGLRAETCVCALISAIYFLVNSGYYLPYGGSSPGPRFFSTAEPFLLLGLPLAIRAWPRLATVLAAVSTIAMFAITYTWQIVGEYPLRGTIWGELWHLARERTHARLYLDLAKSAPTLVGVRRDYAVLLAATAAAGALFLSFLPALRGNGRPST